MKQFVLGLAAVLATTLAVNAMEPAKSMDSPMGPILVDQNGMTLYTFDKDTKGASMSACTDKCIDNWPAFVAGADAMAEGEWTIVDFKASDGTAGKMWAYDGWPLYYFVKDKQPGDTTGDGVGSVWHVVKAGM
jgi:predicted lipoprotein with Yx(FWY)xxD motif